ncbi:unnamed protein product [Musa hybrid cultivar]
MAFPWLKPRNQNPPPSIPAKPNPFLFTIQSHLNAFSDASSSLKAHLDSAVETLGNRARRAVLSGHPHLPSPPPGPPPLPWARISPAGCSGVRRFDLAMSTEVMEERLAGVPVYALSNAAEEFVLVSGVRTGKSLGLFCFKKEDAEALLEQMRSMNRDMREGSKVVAVALNKVFQLKVDGVAFRFVPDSSQVANAIKVKENEGDPVDDFPGVPVFQSRSLVLRSQNKRYRPAFFRKEDLEDSLSRASRQQRQLNPALRKGDIQVCVLEDIIKAMKESSAASKWDDIVFIPPGFNVSTDLTESAQG